MAWSPNGNVVAVVAGGDREIWYSGKRVELCAIPAAVCHTVALPSENVMSLDPSWTGVGSLVYVVAPAVGPRRYPCYADDDEGRRLGILGRVDRPQRGGLVCRSAFVHLHRGRHRLPCPACRRRGGRDPAVTAGGILYVQDGVLRYLPGGKGTPIVTTGGLQSPSPYGNFYGYIAWSEDFAWHR